MPPRSQRSRARAPLPRRWLWLAAGVGGAAVLSSAQASPNYPEVLDRHNGVECPRPLTRCLICHVTAAGGEGSAQQPFARMLAEEYGVEGKSGRELLAALDELPPDRDTDGDGASDLEELGACRNPSGEELREGPGFGCAVALRSGSMTPDLAGISSLLALLLVRQRRSPRAARSSERRRGHP